jgi:hypothetical protein
MDLNRVFVADIETDGFLENLTKVHVCSVGWKDVNGAWQIKSTNSEEDIKKFFGNKSNVIVMHNGRRFDSPAIEKVYGFKVEATIIDSLALAWWLYPNRQKEGKKFGLESFGEYYNIPKPKITDWEGLSYEEYAHRCSEDVKINILLWEDLKAKLELMYKDNPQDMYRLINLLNWIMDCSYMQEVQKIKVDVKKTSENLAYFESLKNEKIEQLKKAMPKIPVKARRKKPNSLYKKDGSLSESGKKWERLTSGLNLPLEYEGEIDEIISWEEPNPNSVVQKKDWLYKLGWKPKTFKHNRNKDTNEVKIVEQVMTEDKMLCPSVLELIKKESAIEALDGLTVLTHRIGILKSFLSNKDENDMIYQGLMGLAVTMRWMHSTLVNLPRYTGKGDLRDGKWIRECLIAGDGNKIVQSDLSGIESRTSDHYIFPINPGRVAKTQIPYFDPHTEISVFANLMTTDEEVFFIFKSAQKDEPNLDVETFSELYKPTDEVRRLLSLPEEEQTKLLKHLKNVRSKGKTCNYASLYNVGAETLGRNLEISKKEAQKLIDAYWEIHFAVKVVTEQFRLKKVGDEIWTYNPISKFFYYTRNTKDIFSVINQSSAVYCFNMWVWNCTNLGIFPVTQSHDDSLYIVKEEDTEKTVAIINEAMRRVNKQLKLNVELACETQAGDNVAETH